jgi:hypothetical protein
VKRHWCTSSACQDHFQQTPTTCRRTWQWNVIVMLKIDYGDAREYVMEYLHCLGHIHEVTLHLDLQTDTWVGTCGSYWMILRWHSSKQQLLEIHRKCWELVNLMAQKQHW